MNRYSQYEGNGVGYRKNAHIYIAVVIALVALNITTLVGVASATSVGGIVSTDNMSDMVAEKMLSEYYGNYDCSMRKSCTEMSSCREARYYYEVCGHSERDGDNDGIPCENICG